MFRGTRVMDLPVFKTIYNNFAVLKSIKIPQKLILLQSKIKGYIIQFPNIHTHTPKINK